MVFQSSCVGRGELQGSSAAQVGANGGKLGLLEGKVMWLMMGCLEHGVSNVLFCFGTTPVNNTFIIHFPCLLIKEPILNTMQ